MARRGEQPLWVAGSLLLLLLSHEFAPWAATVSATTRGAGAPTVRFACVLIRRTYCASVTGP